MGQCGGGFQEMRDEDVAFGSRFGKRLEDRFKAGAAILKREKIDWVRINPDVVFPTAGQGEFAASEKVEEILGEGSLSVHCIVLSRVGDQTIRFG